jgi:hypothetical protein
MVNLESIASGLFYQVKMRFEKVLLHPGNSSIADVFLSQCFQFNGQKFLL